MAIYEKAFSILTTGANAASMELFGYSNARSALLYLEITLQSAPGGPSVFGIGPSSIRGTGPTFATSVIEDVALPADNFPLVALAWTGAAPSVPANYWKIGDLDNVIGDSLVWVFPRGLVVPVIGSIVLWNLTAVAAASVSIGWGD